MVHTSQQQYTHPTPAGHFHNVQTGEAPQTSYAHGPGAFEGLFVQQSNDTTEWQPVRASVGPLIANGPYGLDAINPFVGIGYHHTKQL